MASLPLPSNLGGTSRPGQFVGNARPFLKPDYSSIKHSSSIKLLSVVKSSTEKTAATSNADVIGLTKGELIPFINDPFWVKFRTVLFIIFSFSFLAMLLASIAIVVHKFNDPSCLRSNVTSVGDLTATNTTVHI